MSSGDVNDIERIYSPSQWTKRFKTSDECLESYIRKITKESILVRESIPGDLNIPYGTLEREKYDLFGNNLPDSAPIIFYVHGGYWQEESIGRPNASCIAKIFYKHGIKTFIIGYELCPKVTMDKIVEASQRALRVCLNYAKSKGSRGVCLMGHSAGAQLVAHFFNDFTKSLPLEDLKLLKLSFLIGGVYDLAPLLKTTYNNLLKLNSQMAENLSPMLRGITLHKTKFYVVVGRQDSPAFVEQSESFYEKLKKMDITSNLIILEDVDHFNIVENLTDETFELTKLILKTIKEDV